MIDISEIVKNRKAIEKEKINAFLIKNDFFGVTIKNIDNKYFIRKKDAKLLIKEINKAFSNGKKDHIKVLFKILNENFPETKKSLSAYLKNFEEIDDESSEILIDFFAYTLEKEIFEYNNDEISILGDKANTQLRKKEANFLSGYLEYLVKEYPTKFSITIAFKRRADRSASHAAYSFAEYTKIAFCLLCDDYIESHDMWQKAAKSKNATDTWLYIVLHFVCALRNTDLVRIYNPILPMRPEEVIEKVMNNQFEDSDGLFVINSIITKLEIMPFKPKKTKRFNVSDVKFLIPESCKPFLGKLFALAQAHRMIEGKPDDPIVKCISSYKQIKRNLGDEIGELFRHSDFHSISSNKSYMQSIEDLADEEVEARTLGNMVEGFLIASSARSHKGNYNSFNRNTLVYLKDAKFNNRSPQFLASQLMERGVMSWITSYMLSIVAGEEYEALSPEKQTLAIKEFGLSASQTNELVKIVSNNRSTAHNIIQRSISNKSNAADALLRIVTGCAKGKQNVSICISAAFKKECPYPERGQCFGCIYEITSKAAVTYIVSEINRNIKIAKKTQSEIEKQRCEYLVNKVLRPKLLEIIDSIWQIAGLEDRDTYIKLIGKLTNDE